MEQHGSGHGGATAPRTPSAAGVDTTRVLNLFGYVGPVASLMAHTLFPHGHAHHGGSSGGGHGHGAAPRATHLQRLPAFGEGRLQPRSGGSGGGASTPRGAAGGKTRFVLSRTEDAMDSVLPCAAERMFWRPSRFGNASNLRFNYQA
ncbi:hypothetical protein Rsub_09901 [Raphidocelis subcapitata]|uniref:Uncharacterized protein n=1 Tax=Raphidocelis subcapitata TaxID=307507 RepID=A0A2V0PAL4_9CHLO|nr:hypothetical protein Rsub_09901 [Raphidocelis subcapitata]|eukprot:GBF96896.1 hypothetical protein Rsub_09901 [Raphidocelis subcapitata]